MCFNTTPDVIYERQRKASFRGCSGSTEKLMKSRAELSKAGTTAQLCFRVQAYRSD